MKRLLLLIGILHPVFAIAEEPLRVVATLSTFGSMVKDIGGDRVMVDVIAPPIFDPHFYEPRPSDVRKVQKADLFVHAGLELEAWKEPLLNAAGNRKLRSGEVGDLNLSKRVRLLQIPTAPVTRAMGDIHGLGNPHYWLNPDNAAIMFEEIRDKLIEMDNSGEAFYRGSFSKVTAQLSSANKRWIRRGKQLMGRRFVSYHNEWPYLAEFLGFKVEQFLEPKPGIPPTARHIHELSKYMKQHKVPAILQSTFYPDRDSKSLAEDVGVKVVKLCQGVSEKTECADYISLIDYNVRQILMAVNTNG